MQSRRDFVRMIALLAAGAAALPAQVEAFTSYYEINTPPGAGPFIAMDEIWLCGQAQKSAPVYFDLFRGDNRLMALGINAFGGILRWKAIADDKVIGINDDLRWEMRQLAVPQAGATEAVFEAVPDQWIGQNLTGHVSYIRHDGMRVMKLIDRASSKVLV